MVERMLMRELVEMSYLHTSPVVMDDSASYDEGIGKTLEAMRQESSAARAA